ncbi:Rpn family recombination-promoting nuclease/putative transposase [Saccharibacillus sp. JS10]|uniref:Rpn family recombination-promoting nuclease/putative transposase n=1 Tax=Saccharibacillus sp. JS10 TaxID=2950552 RepID=UPI00210B0CFF|nr:Rpn family recombination-promoting nuclease/putative transposase [Saccharibacillus sp. JS10]MCQ4086787.1 Rpn family recombination-promoting nuclease/putative transposase [Saccharibacillus sp. JS10]
MVELLDPRNDFLFKRIFGSEENRDVLLAFLNRTFTEVGQPPLSEILLLNPYTDKDSPSDKQSILDIRARTVAGELINVEMQLFNRYDMEKRTLFYWSKQYGSQLVEGQSYDTLKRCVTINILNFSLLPNELYHSVFHLREDRTGIPLTDDIEIHFLELPKLQEHAVDLEEGGLANWLLFLKGVDHTHWEVLTMNEPKLKKAMNTLEFLSQDKELRMEYEARQKFLHDQASMMNAAKNAEAFGFKYGMKQGLQQGIEQGIEQGIQKGIEQGITEGIQRGIEDTARRLLKMQLSTEGVAEATGLTIPQVEHLRKSL